MTATVENQSTLVHLRPPDAGLLRVEHLTVEYPIRRSRDVVHAVSDVSFDVLPGETLGLVGESGCGKSTTGRAVLQLPKPTGGSVRLAGEELTLASGERLRELRSQAQMIFQDPVSSLNPRRVVFDIVAEPLRMRKAGTRAEQDERISAILEQVGIDPIAARERRPSQFSGGQCQRICIARALILEPKLLVCDEPVSSLDVSVQAQILNLLEDLKERYGLTMIFVAHDLAVVKNISDRVAVMYAGKVAEIGPAERLYSTPRHHYTAALLKSIPVADPGRRETTAPVIEGELPSPIHPPSGCRFRTRCPAAQALCAEQEPPLRDLDGDGQRFVACHFPVSEGAV